MTSISDKTPLLFIVSNKGTNDNSWQSTDNDRKTEQGLGRIVIRRRVQKNYKDFISADFANLITQIDIFFSNRSKIIGQATNCQSISSRFLVVY